MASGFVTVAAVARWGVADSTVGIYTGALLVGQTIGNLIFGWLADHRGHKFSLELGALFSSVSYALAALAPAPGWFFVVFVLMGVATGAVVVSGILVVMEFCEPGRRPTYIGLANTGVGFISIGAPLLGAWLASIDYGWLFATSALADLTALTVLRWWVKEPRWVEAGARPTLESGVPSP
jgi:MFS family permease